MWGRFIIASKFCLIRQFLIMILKSKNTFLNRFVSHDIFWEPNSVTTPKMFCYNSREGFKKRRIFHGVPDPPPTPIPNGKIWKKADRVPPLPHPRWKVNGKPWSPTVMEFSIIFRTLPLARHKCEWKCVIIWAIRSDRTMQIQKLWISNHIVYLII